MTTNNIRMQNNRPIGARSEIFKAFQSVGLLLLTNHESYNKRQYDNTDFVFIHYTFFAITLSL